MGLDQYAYVCLQEGERKKFFEKATFDKDVEDFVNHTGVRKPHEIAYWRKHPNLQGWMVRLWESKGKPNEDLDLDPRWGSMFNGIELELTWEDLDKLEQDIKTGEMAELKTQGFFFGNPSDSRYREYDLEFIAEAKLQIFMGFKVFYNSSW